MWNTQNTFNTSGENSISFCSIGRKLGLEIISEIHKNGVTSKFNQL